MAEAIALIDYGGGNLHSVQNALKAAGAGRVTVTADPALVRGARRIVLPGVGSFRACYEGLTGIPGMVEALEARLSATLCTDNRLVSHTSVTRELALAVEAFDMSPSQVRSTIIYGFKRSFFPGSYKEKRAWVRQVLDHYDGVVRQWESQAERGPGG